MRVVRFGTLGIVGLSLLAIPAGTRAASGYTSFTSRVCPYRAQVPAGWKVSSDKSGDVHSDTFTQPSAAARGTGIGVLCISTSHSVKDLVSAELNEFKKSGYTMSKPTWEGTTAIATGHKGSGSNALLAELTMFVRSRVGWVILLGGYGTYFTNAVPLYSHVISSFRSK